MDAPISYVLGYCRGRTTNLMTEPAKSKSTITLPSFAKINLSLRILGRRPDGYHEIQTVLQTVSVRDDLTFSLHSGGEIRFSCDKAGLPTDQRNLVVRAALRLREVFKIKTGAEIHLQKTIPMQGGLGGGSSNAAVTLMALAHLWKLESDGSELREIAATLGADVPFFLHGGRALATGTGTTLSLLPDREKVHLLIIAPQAKISTAEAYKSLGFSALTTSASEFILAVSRGDANSQNSDQSGVPGELVNDFEQVIFDSQPEIARARQVLVDYGARAVLLAGSGSSVFGIFDSPQEQQHALEKIRLESGWRIFSCDTISREEYFRALGDYGPRSYALLNPPATAGGTDSVI